MTSARPDALPAERTMTSGHRLPVYDAPPPEQAGPDPVAERESVFNAVLMAVMAGRRMMVVTDLTPDGGGTVAGRVADHVAASTGLGLLATARRGATFEDLLTQVAVALGARPTDDIEHLAVALERCLEEAGAGLLVVRDADLLDPTVIADMFELSGSVTDTGLYMQVLLAGGPGLDRLFEHPALIGATRQIGGARWTTGHKAPPAPVVQAPPIQARSPEPAPEPTPEARPQPTFKRHRRQVEPIPAPIGQASPRSEDRPGISRHREPAPAPAKRGRARWAVAAVLVLMAFGAGFVTNALWPQASRTVSRSTAELLDGDGRSALTAGLPSAPAIQPAPPPQAQPDPEPPATARATAPPAAALPPDWDQPARRSETPRPAMAQQQRPSVAATPALPPQDDRPVVAPPTRLAPSAQQPPTPPRQVAERPAPTPAPSAREVCAEGAGGRAAPDASLSGFAQGFMSDLRNLGRCLGSIANQ